MNAQLAILFSSVYRHFCGSMDATEANQAYAAWCRQQFGLSPKSAQMRREIGSAISLAKAPDRPGDSPGGLEQAAPPQRERRAQDRRGGDDDADADPTQLRAEDIVEAPDLDAASAEATAPEPEPAPYREPPCPYVDPQGEAVLAVYAHASAIHDLTAAERLSYRVFAIAGSLTVLLTEWVRRRWGVDREESVLDLQLLAHRLIEETREVLQPFLSLMGPAIARAAEQQDPGEPEEPAELLLEWVLHEYSDPLHEPESNESERMLWMVLGQLPLFNRDLAALTALREQGGGGAAIDLRLLRRYGQVLQPFRKLIVKASAHLSKGARKAYEAELAQAEQDAAVEAVQGPRAPRESRLIVVGAESLPPAYGFVAKTVHDDRLVAWSFWEPSLTLLLGDRNKGKSHFIRVLTELVTVRPRGLSFMKRGQCPILIESDTTQGEGRFQMLEGFFPNRDAAQLAYLHQHYQTDASNVAYKRGSLLCHYKQVAYYQKLLARYVERGLHIVPLRLGIPDLGSFAFEVMLEWAVGGDQHAVYKNMIQSLVARHGEDLTLDLLRKEVPRLSLRGTTKDTVLALFQMLGDFYSATESVMQHVGEDPVFVLLRGRYLPTNFINPMQAVLFNAFCRSTSHGDRPRIVIFEEFVKVMAGNRAMQRLGMNFAEEMRHRQTSAVCGLQHLRDFPDGLWGAADHHVVFGLSDPKDVKRGKAELYRMRHRRFSEMEADVMPRGRGWLFSRRGNAPELSRGLLVDFRATLLRAGGETLNAGDLEDEEEQQE